MAKKKSSQGSKKIATKKIGVKKITSKKMATTATKSLQKIQAAKFKSPPYVRLRSLKPPES